MSFTVPNEAATYLCDQQTARSPTDSWQIGLYQNTPPIGATTVLAQVTACNFAGYAPISLGSFNPSTIDASNRAAANPVTNNFVFTRSTSGTAQAANGYYVFHAGKLVCLEAFASPFTFTNSGDALTLQFTFRTRSDPV